MKMRMAHLFAGAVLAAPLAGAADYVWTGAVDTNFAAAGNWEVGGSPAATPPANSDLAAGDVVILPPTVTANLPVLTANWNVKELRIQGAGWTLATGTNTLKIGRYGNGVATTYSSGTSVFAGKLSLGSVDTAGPGWDIATGGTLRIDGAVSRYAQTSGGGAIRKRGGGTLELNTGTSTLNGLQVEAGIVRIVAGIGLLDANKNLVVNGGVYDLNGNNVTVMNVTGTAGGAVSNGAPTAATFTSQLNGSPTAALRFAGNLNVSWHTAGAGSAPRITSPASSYTGTTTIRAKTHVIIGHDALPNADGPFGNAASAILIGWDNATQSSGANGLLTEQPVVVGRDVSLRTTSGTKTIGTREPQAGTTVFSGAIDVGRHANASLTVQAATNGPVVISGAIVENDATGNGALTKTGAGLVRLTSTNSYAGGTTVSAGRLEVSNTLGSGTGPGAVAVSANATLGGVGTIDGATTVHNGATLTAGADGDVGTLTLGGGLTHVAGSKLVIDVADGSADRVQVTGGSVTVTGPVTVDVNLVSAATAAEYAILDWSGAASGAPLLSDFELGVGGDDFRLSLRDNVLYLRPAGTPGTLIILR